MVVVVGGGGGAVVAANAALEPWPEKKEYRVQCRGFRISSNVLSLFQNLYYLLRFSCYSLNPRPIQDPTTANAKPYSMFCTT